jgi:exodeoxyribonuclease V alpha subunit
VSYRFFGVWAFHDVFGPQFRFEAFVPCDEQGEMGTIAFLERSGLGISRQQAKEMFRAYGNDAIKVLREDPARVANQIGISWETSMSASTRLMGESKLLPARLELFQLFAKRGFPRGAVDDCLQKWGMRAPTIVKKNPFRMLTAGITGAGFKRTDKLYLDGGGNPYRLKRQLLAGWHRLHNSQDGDTWVSKGAVSKAILEEIGGFANLQIDRAIALGIRAGWLLEKVSSDGTAWYAERFKARAEQRLSLNAVRIASDTSRIASIPIESLEVSRHQLEKLKAMASSGLSILAGTPGTGKTFVASAILKACLSLVPAAQIAVCAPTGKAAVRITEAMQKNGVNLAASTIHRLLGIGGDGDGRMRARFDETNKLPCQIVVVDEVSMCDTSLLAALLAAIPDGAGVLLVGDPYQLPPVGHGAPLRDLIAADIPCALLTEVQRNAGAIVKACAAIKDDKPFDVWGFAKEEEGHNLVCPFFSAIMTPRSCLKKILEAMPQKGINPTWDCQVICPRNDGPEVGRHSLNLYLQDLLNPMPVGKEFLAHKHGFRRKDKVIWRENQSVKAMELPDDGRPEDRVDSYVVGSEDFRIANGDMGVIKAVSDKAAIVLFSCPDRMVRIPLGKGKQGNEYDDRPASNGDGKRKAKGLELGYAITGHLSQGSEWPVAIVVADPLAGFVGCREWVYTAISRGKRFTFIVGQPQVLQLQAGRSTLGKRKTFLRELLTGELK